MVVNLSVQNSVVSQWMAEIRDVTIQNDRMRFRRNMERIGEVAAYEISKLLQYSEHTIQTPMGESVLHKLEHQPVVATILRAGVPLHQGLLNYFDGADAAFIAAFRKHRRDGSFEIEQQYITCPDIEGRNLIIADPMLATGASLLISLEALERYGKVSALYIVSAIACTEGIENVLRKFPEASIFAGDIDDDLTAKGYIVPGLGDAGDLAYGSKLQA
jgi:uracil phosphoribosyltransferase